jgi:hypothetical protein
MILEDCANPRRRPARSAGPARRSFSPTCQIDDEDHQLGCLLRTSFAPPVGITAVRPNSGIHKAPPPYMRSGEARDSAGIARRLQHVIRNLRSGSVYAANTVLHANRLGESRPRKRSRSRTLSSYFLLSGGLLTGCIGTLAASAVAQEPNPTSVNAPAADMNPITMQNGIYIYRVHVVERNLDCVNYLNRSGSTTIGLTGRLCFRVQRAKRR